MASLNADGLLVKYGTEQSAPSRGGEVVTTGNLRVTEVIVVGTEVPLTATTVSSTNIALTHGIEIPDDAFIEKVEFVVDVPFAGVNATLNIGLVRSDRSTEIDFDGLAIDIPTTAIDAVGDLIVITPGATYAGALIGTQLTNKGIVTLDYDTAAFTAGRGVARIFWRMPAAV